ncbi:MMPL family transporter [Saccharothrix syringae]|uniref:MMPL family transporter n=1 Tax=Saccharothrix syringae TaxID=103733 RepID=UPI000A6FB9A4|nr:MMPL family transporter [Saccharothrix syringae]
MGALNNVRLGGYLDDNSESTAASKLINSEFGGRYNLILLVTSESGDVDRPEVAAEGARLSRDLAGENSLTNVTSYWATGIPALKTADGKSAIIAAHVEGDEDAQLRHAEDLHQKYTSWGGPFRVEFGGQAAVNRDVFDELMTSLVIAEAIAIPVTLLLLILAFGSVIAALLPLVIGVLAIVGTMAEIAVLGNVTDVSIFATNLTTGLGLGLGIDYALFLVARFREQLAAGDDVETAVATTTRTAGRTILFSAITVAAALATMAVFPLYFLQSLAYAGVGVVAIAAVASLVVVPALLSVLGHRVNALKLPWSKNNRGSDAPFWGRLASRVGKRPVLAAVPAVLVLLLMASPALHAAFGTVDDRVLHHDVESRSVNDRLRQDFGAFPAAPIEVVLQGEVDQAAVADYAREVSLLPDVTSVQTSAGIFSRGAVVLQLPTDAIRGKPHAQWLSVATGERPKSEPAVDLMKQLRGRAGPSGTTVLVGGSEAEMIDTQQAIVDKLPWAFAIIVVITFLVLFLFTGGVLQPVRALVLNGLSLAATFGIMVWGFQDGHLSGLLGFTPQPTDTAMTVFVFCVVFGLSMDYEVFLISRIKELHDLGHSPVEAVSLGLARTGRIVSTAAGLLAVVFFAFLASSISFLQLFALGAGAAILIDAIIVRGVLVPAAIALLGRAAWWSPPLLRRAYTRVKLAD